MLHETKGPRETGNNYFIISCRCGWVYGPDTEYQCNQEYDEHVLAVGYVEEDQE